MSSVFFLINEKRKFLMTLFQHIFLIFFFGTISVRASAEVTKIYPAMGVTLINELLNRANPGDTLLFHPGTYRGPFALNKVHGSVNLPVVIAGVAVQEGAGAVIDGQTDPGMLLKQQAFLLQDCSWISIENFLLFQNPFVCWFTSNYNRHFHIVEFFNYLNINNIIINLFYILSYYMFTWFQPSTS